MATEEELYREQIRSARFSSAIYSQEIHAFIIEARSYWHIMCKAAILEAKTMPELQKLSDAVLREYEVKQETMLDSFMQEIHKSLASLYCADVGMAMFPTLDDFVTALTANFQATMLGMLIMIGTTPKPLSILEHLKKEAAQN